MYDEIRQQLDQKIEERAQQALAELNKMYKEAKARLKLN